MAARRQRPRQIGQTGFRAAKRFPLRRGYVVLQVFADEQDVHCRNEPLPLRPRLDYGQTRLDRATDSPSSERLLPLCAFLLPMMTAFMHPALSWPKPSPAL